MRYGFEQSAPALVARKSANQGPPGPAESTERRAGAKGNPRNPKPKRVARLPPITVKALHEAYLGWKRKAAPGVDGMTWDPYADGLWDQLTDRPERVHSGRSRAGEYRSPRRTGARDRSVSRRWRTRS